MTVKELRETLSQYPDDMAVWLEVSGDECDFGALLTQVSLTKPWRAGVYDEHVLLFGETGK